MARTREFDEEKALEAITFAFWKNGYDATNLGHLEAATSMVRTSLYNAFGNKADMFELALQHYHSKIGALIEHGTQQRGIQSILTVFAAMMKRDGDLASWPAGCLMVSAASQSVTLEPRHIEQVQAYRAMLVQAVQSELSRDQKGGHLRSDLDAGDAAELLICTMWGALATDCLLQSQSHSAGGLATLAHILEGWSQSG